MRLLKLTIVIIVSAFWANAQDAPTSIAAIQGTQFRSPLAGKKVTTEGVVTALRRSGFYIQTPETDYDDDPMSSEGVYVYTQDEPSKDLKIGDLVRVKGIVAEFRPNRERYALFLTEIVDPKVSIISSGHPLPEPIEITNELLTPKGNPDQLEPFEGMRVRVGEMLVVAPTGGREDEKRGFVSDGVFFGVVAGTPRPFREPGLSVLAVLLDRLPPTIPVFDSNPELIRVDSDGLNGGEAIDVTAEAKITNISGIMDYAYGSYTIMMGEAPGLRVEGMKSVVPVSAAATDEVTIASFNLENFFDDENNSKLVGKETEVSKEYFEKRLTKTSLAIRKVLALPDVLGVIEVENKIVLEKLAKRVNEDVVADGGVNPEYTAYLEESNDLRGIDVGFLIKKGKVNITCTEQLAADTKLKYRNSNPKETLFSRPPFLIEAEVARKDGSIFSFTVVVNHFKSYRGIDDARDGDRVRNKKRMQAEFLAKTVFERQTKNPEEKIVLIGDFNTFQFNDGYNDLIGILKGQSEQKVLVPSTNHYKTNLISMVDHITVENRYSYVFGGSAQVLDHVLINQPMIKYAKKFGYARFNADFPKSMAEDENRPERVSDHDVPVLFLNIGTGTEMAAAR